MFSSASRSVYTTWAPHEHASGFGLPPVRESIRSFPTCVGFIVRSSLGDAVSQTSAFPNDVANGTARCGNSESLTHIIDTEVSFRVRVCATLIGQWWSAIMPV